MMNDIERALQALGFIADGDGTLRAPAASVTLKPIAPSYYELKISIGGNAVSCVVAGVALKLAPPSEAVDPEALLNVDPSSRHRPW